MFLVFALIFLYFESFSCNANVIANSRTTWGPDNSNIKSVNNIKEDLRRNNDDYRDKSLRSNKLFADSVNNNNVSKPPNRRAYEIVRDGKIFNDSLINSKSKRFAKVTPKVLEIDVVSKATGKDKTEKRLRFMNKYKQMMSDYLASKKVESQTEAMPKVAEQVENAEEAETGEVREAGKAGKAGKKGEGYKRAYDDEERQENGRVPSPYELDMAPARGGRVHSLRQKDRLCHRNVMIPEGPKYDSKGHVYLKEHGGKGGHDFANTIVPKMVLPRCCNCCKKSVLGCE